MSILLCTFAIETERYVKLKTPDRWAKRQKIMRLYYVERKCYYRGHDGLEYQCADGGIIPILYETKEKAIDRAERMVSVVTKSNHYKITIPTEKNPAVKEYCLYAVRMEKYPLREEIRVYEVETLND